MAAHEIHSILLADVLFSIELIDSDGTKIGNQLVTDTLGFEAMEFIMASVDEAGDGLFSAIPKHGDTNVFSEHVDVPAEELLGPALFIEGGNKVVQQGYIGKKRFLSANILASVVTSGRRVGVILVSNAPKRAPVNVGIIS